jgi:biopolymer transport protein ExbD
MNLRRRQREDPEVKLTSLIDVVFLLLIFFMVTTTFNRDNALEVDLPEASGVPVPDQKSVEITIDAAGEYYVNRQQLINTQIETLKRALRKVAGDDPKTGLIISADGHTPHQAVVTAMDAAGQLGFVHLSIVTREPPNDSAN